MEKKTIEGIVSGVTILPLTNPWTNSPVAYTAWVSLTKCAQSSGFYLPVNEQSTLMRYASVLPNKSINADLRLIKDESYMARHLVIIESERHERALF
nr:hypothetical protein [Nanoarchaeum sp.]